MAHLIKQDQDKHLKFVLDQPEEGKCYFKFKWLFVIQAKSFQFLLSSASWPSSTSTMGSTRKSAQSLPVSWKSHASLKRRFELCKYPFPCAGKLETTFECVKGCLDALVCLLIDSTKLHTTEEDFQSLRNLQFTDGQIAILWQFVNSKRNLVENILKHSNDSELHFRDLEWRLEAKVASRAMHKQATPVIAMKLHLDSEVVNEHKEKLQRNGDAPEEEFSEPNTRKEVLLQTDPTSLIHLIQVLEQALIDSKTHRVRNFVKSFQK